MTPWQKLKQWERRVDCEEFWRRSPNAGNSKPIAGCVGLLPISVGSNWTPRGAPCTPVRTPRSSTAATFAPLSARSLPSRAQCRTAYSAGADTLASLRCPTSVASVPSTVLRGEIQQERRKRVEAEDEVTRLQGLLDQKSSRGFSARGDQRSSRGFSAREVQNEQLLGCSYLCRPENIL